MNLWFRIRTNKPYFREIQLVGLRMWNSSYPSGLSRFTCLGSTSHLLHAFISFTLGSFLSPKTGLPKCINKFDCTFDIVCDTNEANSRDNAMSLFLILMVCWSASGVMVMTNQQQKKKNKSKRWRKRSGFRRMLYICFRNSWCKWPDRLNESVFISKKCTVHLHSHTYSNKWKLEECESVVYCWVEAMWSHWMLLQLQLLRSLFIRTERKMLQSRVSRNY